MTTVFKLLCASQFVIGFLMFVFSFVDRFKVKLACSFIMLPLWIAILAAAAGGCSLFIGNFYQRRGFFEPSMVSGLRAINIVCAAVAFYALYCYGTVLMVFAAANDKSSQPVLPDKQGITAFIVILCIAEMLCGVWLALLDKEAMFIGSTPPIQQQVPAATNYHVPQGPRQAPLPTLNFSTQPEYQQQRQQQQQQVPGM